MMTNKNFKCVRRDSSQYFVNPKRDILRIFQYSVIPNGIFSGYVIIQALFSKICDSCLKMKQTKIYAQIIFYYMFKGLFLTSHSTQVQKVKQT